MLAHTCSVLIRERASLPLSAAALLRAASASVSLRRDAAAFSLSTLAASKAVAVAESASRTTTGVRAECRCVDVDGVFLVGSRSTTSVATEACCRAAAAAAAAGLGASDEGLEPFTAPLGDDGETFDARAVYEERIAFMAKGGAKGGTKGGGKGKGRYQPYRSRDELPGPP